MAELIVNLIGYGIAFIFIVAAFLSFSRFARSGAYSWRGDIDMLLTGVSLGGAVAAVVWTHWVVKTVL